MKKGNPFGHEFKAECQVRLGRGALLRVGGASFPFRRKAMARYAIGIRGGSFPGATTYAECPGQRTPLGRGYQYVINISGPPRPHSDTKL